MSRKRIGVLLSGGLDSAALAAFFLKKRFEVWPIYVRCGLRWEKTELYWIRRFMSALPKFRIRPLAIVELNLESAYRRNWSQKGQTPGLRSPDQAVFLPARNLLLAIKSALYLYPEGVTQLAIGTLRGNPFKDARKNYFKMLGRLLSESFDQPIQVLAPFATSTKAGVIRKMQDFPVHLSFSCINPVGRLHCGKCNKCAERQKAFKSAGVKDQTRYCA